MEKCGYKPAYKPLHTSNSKTGFFGSTKVREFDCYIQKLALPQIKLFSDFSPLCRSLASRYKTRTMRTEELQSAVSDLPENILRRRKKMKPYAIILIIGLIGLSKCTT